MKSYYDSSRLEGGGIRFVTESVVYLTDWEYEYGEYVEDVVQLNYTYTAPTGFIYKNGRGIKFEISGNYLTLYGAGDGGIENMVFTKQ